MQHFKDSFVPLKYGDTRVQSVCKSRCRCALLKRKSRMYWLSLNSSIPFLKPKLVDVSSIDLFTSIYWPKVPRVSSVEKKSTWIYTSHDSSFHYMLLVSLVLLFILKIALHIASLSSIFYSSKELQYRLEMITKLIIIVYSKKWWPIWLFVLIQI